MKRLLALCIVSLLFAACEEYVTYDSMTNESSETVSPGSSCVFYLVGEYDKVASSGSIVLSLKSSKLSGEVGSTYYSYEITNPSGQVYSSPEFSFSGTSTYTAPRDLPSYMLDGQSTKGTWEFVFSNTGLNYSITVDYVDLTVMF
jgi:hypothetical protein